MADIDSTLRLWSVTASSNKPVGGTVIGAGLDDNLRQIQATTRQFLASQGTSVVASATTDLSTVDGFLIPISGNTTITGFGTEAAGIGYLLNFSGTPTIKNSSTVAVPGAADWSIAAGDMVIAQSLGSGNWKLWGATKANGLPVRAIQPTRQVFTTGASVTYSTPANCSRINVRLVGGGGGSGHAPPTSGTQGSAGGGGGSGAYTEKLIVSPSASYLYYVGTGGAAEASGTTTSFGVSTAPGGSPGAAGTASTALGPDGAGGTGGVQGTNGDFMVTGSDGGSGYQNAAAFNIGGYGAASFLGGQVAAVRTVTNSAGVAGKNFGGGAAGAANAVSQGSTAGAAGAPGIVIIDEYYD